jgi:hypothetical protein
MARRQLVKMKIDKRKAKSIVLSIRISQEEKEFMEKNEFAPALTFRWALKQLGFKQVSKDLLS